MRKLKTIRNSNFALGALMLSLSGSALGCAGAVDGDESEASRPGADKPAVNDGMVDPVAVGVLDADWVGFDRGVLPPKVKDLGKAEVVSVEEALLARETLTSLGQARYQRPAVSNFKDMPETEFEVVDFATERRYHVSLSEENIALLDEERYGEEIFAGESADVKEAFTREGPIDKAIIGTTDTRKRFPIPDDTAANQAARDADINGWLSAIGLLRIDGCTGTLVSNRAYVTAAHCVYTSTGKVIKRDLIPRAEENRDGFPEVPWGFWTATQVSVPGAFTQNECYKTNAPANCGQYDVAVVNVTPDVNNPGHSRKFKFAAETRSQLLTRTLRNVGYPLCDQSDKPANCGTSNMRLFGDAQACVLGPDVIAAPAPTAADPTPVAPFVQHKCDTSKGHSGGPIFYYQTVGAPVLVGVHVGSQLLNGTQTNRFKRFGKGTVDFISARD